MTLTENARRLEAATVTTLSETGIPNEQDILSLASQLRKIPVYSVTDEEFDLVIRRLHQALRIDMGLGTRIVNEYTPWLQARKPSIDPFYWRRYQLSLKAQGLAPKVVNALDNVTDEILDLSGDPSSHNGWPRRGLVMGDVQSGKTSNYTALISKAADAGYRLVILLTGTLESLRRQTQGRLDAGFVGLDSSGVVTRNRKRREIGVGLIDGRRAAGVFTSTLTDFRVSTVNQLGFRLDAFNEPVLLVVKKNARILANLTEWLRNYNANSEGLIDLPLLLVDDEADNASVNTNPEKATAINAAIRSVLKVFPRSTYIGFTATPFANVFIHPESTEDMLGDDLFPRDFVYALDSPSNYIGASKLFGNVDRSPSLRLVEDGEAIFPRGHTAALHVSKLPTSLLESIRTFVIANAIMDLRGNCPRHRSMLINVSHFTAVQEQVRDIVDEFMRKLQEDVRNYSALPEDEALQNLTIADLLSTYRSEFAVCEFSWTEVQAALSRAALPISVRSVNQRSGAASVSYVGYEQDGLRLIAVGGNSLSRGLTLEGLCVSYFLRYTQMYDSLLQMGRWFGYRPNYEDLMRLWMTEQAANWYSHIAEASEELRDQVRHMQTSRLRPIDFGIKVRSHPDALVITARNKMRHSSEVTRIMSVSEEALETPRLLIDKAIITGNYRAMMQAIDRIPSESHLEGASAVWTGVPKEIVVELLRAFVAHPLNVTFHPEDLASFVHRSSEPKLQWWDVVVPSGSGKDHPIRKGVAVRLQQRKLAIDERSRSILVNEQKLRVGSRGLERAGMSDAQIAEAERTFREDPENSEKQNVPDRAYRAYRKRPLLALHFLEGKVGEADFAVAEGTVLGALGLSFPRLSSESERVIYRINLVEIRNLLSGTEAGEESDDAEEELIED
ncbi:Z1 domain-containing protein [Ramlibacter solisilvae]|uniref:Putative endonuclease Z1 domain-containing protein n=1 Tax=Ramlibacter tataouinensis TaxID=94132 RepID=A0A127JTK4_9BURK|nr:Z1 domain-containing protein [Ramlibacter tataouinensis]AMO23245.1 hypothetical protein UC35_10500 [Ramlibacter tataouinensis]